VRGLLEAVSVLVRARRRRGIVGATGSWWHHVGMMNGRSGLRLWERGLVVQEAAHGTKGRERLARSCAGERSSAARRGTLI
jgi:hypothetical protein